MAPTEQQAAKPLSGTRLPRSTREDFRYTRGAETGAARCPAGNRSSRQGVE